MLRGAAAEAVHPLPRQLPRLQLHQRQPVRPPPLHRLAPPLRPKNSIDTDRGPQDLGLHSAQNASQTVEYQGGLPEIAGGADPDRILPQGRGDDPHKNIQEKEGAVLARAGFRGEGGPQANHHQAGGEHFQTDSRRVRQGVLLLAKAGVDVLSGGTACSLLLQRGLLLLLCEGGRRPLAEDSVPKAPRESGHPPPEERHLPVISLSLCFYPWPEKENI